MTEGKIIKGIGGFYYVETAEAVYECKAKGSFRNMKLSPLVGDNVEISVNINAENRIEKILSRKNELVRPPLANLDQLFIVASLVDPVINTFIIDKLIAVAEYKGIEPVVVLTKTDLSSTYEDYKKIYDSAGFKTILCSNADKSGTEEIKALLSGKVSAFTGNTGVGKSTLLNSVDENLMLKTGETSKKLGRGKHTTRHSELFVLDSDTYFGKCRFSTCSHIGEKGCAVCEAVEKGEIERSRHESYVQMYNEVKDIKEWEIKK